MVYTAEFAADAAENNRNGPAVYRYYIGRYHEIVDDIAINYGFFFSMSYTAARRLCRNYPIGSI